VKEAFYDKSPIKEPIILLLKWFDFYEDLAQELFPELHRMKMELYIWTIEQAKKEDLFSLLSADASTVSQIAKILRENPTLLEKFEDLAILMEEFNVSDISDIRTLILQQKMPGDGSKMEITEEVLISLGVTSLKELKQILKDPNLFKFFHKSKPSLEMFLRAKEMIERSKANVMKYLKTLPEYDCTEAEEIAPTVFGGVKRDGYPINIVVRPSDYGHIIIFYTSEKDVLDFTNSELWIDNGKEKPEHLTLGKILKLTGINRIPVENGYNK
jgi:hypothetical protein